MILSRTALDDTMQLFAYVVRRRLIQAPILPLFRLPVP